MAAPCSGKSSWARGTEEGPGCLERMRDVLRGLCGSGREAVCENVGAQTARCSHLSFVGRHFLVAAVMNTMNLLVQNLTNLFSGSSGGPKPKMSPTRLKSKYWHEWFLLEMPGENFQLLEAASISWLPVTSLQSVLPP